MSTEDTSHKSPQYLFGIKTELIKITNFDGCQLTNESLAVINGKLALLRNRELHSQCIRTHSEVSRTILSVLHKNEVISAIDYASGEIIYVSQIRRRNLTAECSERPTALTFPRVHQRR